MRLQNSLKPLQSQRSKAKSLKSIILQDYRITGLIKWKENMFHD